MIVGVIIGILVRNYATLSSIEKSYFSFPGEIFLRVLKLLIFPLILSSLITSMGNIVKTKSGKPNSFIHDNLTKLMKIFKIFFSTIGKVAIRAILYYMFTTFTAIVIALVLSTTIRPGSRAKSSTNSSTQNSNNKNNQTATPDQKILVINTICDLIR